MKIRLIKLGAIVFLMACSLPIILLDNVTSSDTDSNLTGTGLGSVTTLEANYREWEAAYLENGGDRNLILPVGAFKGLTTDDSPSHGQAQLNLIEGRIYVVINELSQAEKCDVWLIDNKAGETRTVMPEPGDTMVRIGSLKHENGVAKLEANLGSKFFTDFDLDLVIVSRSGQDPTTDRLLVGTTTLFHRLYRSAQQGKFGVLEGNDKVVEPTVENGSWWARIKQFFNPTAQAQIGPIPNPSTPLQQLITEGRRSFFNDTFNGNGRTCGTCHRENNNLTIDPEFIATLPPNDPLFVAEFNPNLSKNFENPVLMRRFGLILENVDGFDNLASKFVMRGVPHTLALLPNTLAPALNDGTTTPPNERTGWSGDGAPGTGTLREFIIGAVTQHYPKTLKRVPGSDFVLPTVAQLDALEAFQKSTGRREDLDLNALRLKSVVAERGRQIFLNPGALLGQPDQGAGKCFLCHINAGASDFFEPGRNGTFNTGVENLPDHPADLSNQPNPPDGGFGRTPGPGGFGIGSFNTPVLVEAADTGPFFHNNAIETIEGAVAFYTGPAFSNSPFGQVVGGINLDATQIVAVAAFLRVINAAENIRSSVDLEERAKIAVNFAQAQELIKLSFADLDDAFEVLDCAGLHPEAQQKLIAAQALDALALITADRNSRNGLLNQAIALKKSARSDMIQ
ncbi:MAG: hypothetical protein AB1489_31665 [Acidobacteriota bacterium]